MSNPRRVSLHSLSVSALSGPTTGSIAAVPAFAPGTIPYTPPPSGVSSTQPGTPSLPSLLPQTQGCKHVMVVDDSPTIRKIVETCLKRAEFAVTCHPDGVAALKALAAQEYPLPDLIILDVNLPKMDGYQFARILKQKRQFADTVILMLSGRDGILDRLKGRLAGASGYMTKPFKTADLVHLVNALLGVPQP